MTRGRSSSAETVAPETGLPFLGASAADIEPAESVSQAVVAWDWERLDARLRPRLLTVGERRFGLTREEAEDVLQDTFESVFTKRPRVRNMEGYLVGSFFNRCCDRLERRRRLNERPISGEFPDARAAGRIVDGIHVRSAFRLMSPACRQLIRAYCLLRLSLAEAAAEAGCTVPTVWKRLNQCVKRMRGCLA
jgi:RNA polymerase sigma factor (sigma-70 family)